MTKFVKMKKTASYIVLVFVYLLFVADRFVLAISNVHLPNFETWSELHLPEEHRTHKNVLKSLVRVFVWVMLYVVFIKWRG